MALKDIRVLVVDDSAVVRSVIADSISNTPGMKVVGKAGDGRQALAAGFPRPIIRRLLRPGTELCATLV